MVTWGFYMLYSYTCPRQSPQPRQGSDMIYRKEKRLEAKEESPSSLCPPPIRSASGWSVLIRFGPKGSSRAGAALYRLPTSAPAESGRRPGKGAPRITPHPRRYSTHCGGCRIPSHTVTIAGQPRPTPPGVTGARELRTYVRPRMHPASPEPPSRTRGPFRASPGQMAADSSYCSPAISAATPPFLPS